MDKKSAEDILSAALAMSRPIDVLVGEIYALPDGEEKKGMFRAMGDIMGALAMHIVFPIVKQYPELDPDK